MLYTDFAARIAAAAVFGFIIGFERQKTGHPAGIQTNVLVCLGACIYQITAYTLDSNEVVRVAAQIVTGVGFLGSGIIFKDGINVRGINTAATIWCGAAIGILTASGELIYAAAATGVIIVVNVSFQQRTGIINNFLRSDASVTYYTLSAVCDDNAAMDIRSAIIESINGSKLTLTDLRSEESQEMGRTVITAGMYHSHIVGRMPGKRRDTHIEKLASRLSREASLHSVKWELV